MRLDGLPSYDRKYHGRVYRHVGTFEKSDSLYANHKDAKRLFTQHEEKGSKCLMERHGKGFSVYVCDS